MLKAQFSMKKSAFLLLIPSLIALTGCTQQVQLQGAEGDLAQRQVTEAHEAVVYPDDLPSVPDGKVVWEKMNCAECHGATGATSVSVAAVKTGAEPGSLKLNDPLWVAKQMPTEQYEFLTYGRDGLNHPALKDKLTRRQIWDLVFYSRSLAVPAITQAEFDAIDPVFGANCAVCHGKRGHGDGPLARNMEPLPANFHQFNRFYERTDEQIWDHIAYGIPWEGMPNFLGKVDRTKNVKFDKEYIHAMVKYVRNFHSTYKSTNPQTASTSKSVGQ